SRMTSPSRSAMIAGPCSSSVAVTNAVNPVMSASTRTPLSVWLLMPDTTPPTPRREIRLLSDASGRERRSATSGGPTGGVIASGPGSPSGGRRLQGGSSMLSRDDNALLTRVERGTPMGTTMRRFWVPAVLTREVAEPDGAPVRVRLLGEDLVAFRDTRGRVGLLEEFCPHRRASLFF